MMSYQATLYDHTVLIHTTEICTITTYVVMFDEMTTESVTPRNMLHTMYVLMSYQVTVPAKYFLTHITGVWPLPTMYKLMCR